MYLSVLSHVCAYRHFCSFFPPAERILLSSRLSSTWLQSLSDNLGVSILSFQHENEQYYRFSAMGYPKNDSNSVPTILACFKLSSLKTPNRNKLVPTPGCAISSNVLSPCLVFWIWNFLSLVSNKLTSYSRILESKHPYKYPNCGSNTRPTLDSEEMSSNMVRSGVGIITWFGSFASTKANRDGFSKATLFVSGGGIFLSV